MTLTASFFFFDIYLLFFRAMVIRTYGLDSHCLDARRYFLFVGCQCVLAVYLSYGYFLLERNSDDDILDHRNRTGHQILPCSDMRSVAWHATWVTCQCMLNEEYSSSLSSTTIAFLYVKWQWSTSAIIVLPKKNNLHRQRVCFRTVFS